METSNWLRQEGFNASDTRQDGAFDGRQRLDEEEEGGGEDGGFDGGQGLDEEEEGGGAEQAEVGMEEEVEEGAEEDGEGGVEEVLEGDDLGEEGGCFEMQVNAM